MKVCKSHLYFQGSSGYRRAQNSFLFSLVNPSGLRPTKMRLRAEQEGYSIWCNSSYGPVFGGGNTHDILIHNAPNINNCPTTLNNTYQCAVGSTFLTGNQSFRVNEMEVFGFDT